MNREESKEEIICIDPFVKVCRSVVSYEKVKALRAEAKAELRKVARSASMPMDTVLRLTSAWGYEQPWVQQTVKHLESEIKNRLYMDGLPTRFVVREAIDATLFVQNGIYESKTHAHQDISYKWNRNRQSRYALTTWLAMDTCDGESGSLRFSDGYPKQPVSVRIDYLKYGFRDLAETEKWYRGESTAKMDAGDMVVFDSLAWHSSHTAKGGAMRMAIAIRWKSANRWEENVELYEPTIVADEFGMDNSGRLLIDAICRFQQLEGSEVVSERQTTHQVVYHFISRSTSLLNRLKPESRVALTDLSNALLLHDDHHARVSSRVWTDVRDVVLPDLRRLIAGVS